MSRTLRTCAEGRGPERVDAAVFAVWAGCGDWDGGVLAREASPWAESGRMGGMHEATARPVADVQRASVVAVEQVVEQTVVVVARSSGAISDALAEAQSDAPACDVCGTITVRSGTCYKCLNCGNTMGCS